MKIAVSADCFSSFTSGFPVRGMTMALIKGYPEINFRLYYTRQDRPEALIDFYSEIESLENVEVCQLNVPRYKRILNLLRGRSAIPADNGCDLFLNPGHLEYIKEFKGPQVCSIADLSTLKGLSTNKYSWLFKRLNRRRMRQQLPRMSRIVSISEFTRDDLLHFFPNLATPIEVVHNGIADWWFTPDETPAKNISLEIKERLDIHRPYFIWWGLISRRKNIVRLIEAYRLAQSRIDDLPDLLLIGNREAYMQGIEDLFGNGVINIPFQDNQTLRSLVAASRGLIFPSLYEGFGLPVIEAFAQGVNVACAAITSLPEVAGGHALLFDPTNTDEMSRAIVELHRLPLSEHNRNTLRAYASRFRYSAAANRYFKIITQLTDTNSKPV